MLMNLIQRFISYVKIPTTSCEESNTVPSSSIQLDLANKLIDELKSLGIKDACIKNGVVYAHLKSNCDSKVKIGFIAHMDTSPEASGVDVNPKIIPSYDGKDIILKDNVVISPKDFPILNQKIGKTIITSDGTTLLGADDKAGVAEIMSMLDYMVTSKLPRHNISVAFTPDEEIGRGTDNFDLKLFDADFAYTVDGGKYDEFSCENFNAAKATIKITGVGIHPGDAKGKMVNAARIAARLDSLLPDGKRPELTDGYEGFFHLTSLKADETEASISYIVRSFDKGELEAMKDTLTYVCDLLQIENPKASISLTITDQYENMKYNIEKNKNVIDIAIKAMKDAGIEPTLAPIRGGTDGARLTAMGLPTPNMPTGGYNYHGVREYAVVEEMELCCKYLINIAKK